MLIPAARARACIVRVQSRQLSRPASTRAGIPPSARGKIDLSTPEILRATTRQGAEVVFALRNLDGQMQRWRVIADAGRLRGKALTSLDLSITNSLPSLWVEASAVTPVAPRPLKPLRARKKNV